MAGITHKFVDTWADLPDATQVRPSNWNDSHQVITYTLQTDDNVSQGQVVRAKNTSRIALASARNADGLALATKTIGQAVDAVAGIGFEMADWTNVIGTTLLTPGLAYYLDQSNPGMLTTTPPSTGGQYIKEIGQAVTTTIFSINIQDAILL